MADEPYYTPGQSDGVPPQSPTQFGPAKPAGPDPVSPMPLPEGSEVDRHAQVMAFDPVSGLFKPVEWISGKMKVEAIFSGDIQIGAVEIKDGDTDTRAKVKTDGVDNALVMMQNSQPLPLGAATEATLSSIKTQTDKLKFVGDDLKVIASISIAAVGLNNAADVRIDPATEQKQDTGNSSLASIKTNTDNLDVALSTRASEATLATRASESTLATRATEATLATRASEATLALIKTNTDSLDVALSTRAAEATLATRASETTLALIKAKTDNLDVALSTRASEATLATRATEATLATRASEATLLSVKTDTSNIDVALSTRASEATLATRASEATLLTIKSDTSNLDVALSTRASEATLATRASESTLALIKAKTDNLDVALSTRASEATLATRASEATLLTRATEATLLGVKAGTDNLDVALSTRASEATLATKASEATLALIKAKTDNLDVALSTRASEATLATRASEATLLSVKTDTSNLDVALSTRASEATLATRATEATLALIKAKTDNLDVALSTRATEATLATRASEATLATRATEATLALIKAKTDNLDVALSTRASEATLATRASETTLATRAADATLTGGTARFRLLDSGGTLITAQANGTQRALDVGVNVAGVQIDPRVIRALTATDVVTVAQATAANLNATVVGSGNFTVVQATGTNLHIVVDSGTITANQGGAPWAQNITQFGGSAVVTGTGASGVGIPRVTVANDSNVLVTQFGTWTVQPGNTANTTAWLVTGTGGTFPVTGTITANIGTTGGLALDATLGKLTIAQGTALGANTQALVGGSVTTAEPTYTTGQISPLSLTPSGRLRTESASIGGTRRTYSATIVSTTIAAAATDFFTIIGSATQTIRVMKVTTSMTQTTAGAETFSLVKRSTADTGGTSTPPTIVPHDSNNAAATAVVTAYTANPTLGTAVGTMAARRVMVGTEATASAQSSNFQSTDQGITLFEALRPAQAIVLRGAAQQLALNFNGGTATGNVATTHIEWTEEA